MKRTVRVVALILLMVSLLSVSTAFASERASSYINKYVGSATGGNGDAIEIFFTITATGTMTDLGATKIEIKDATNTTVETYEYTDAGYSHMMGHNRFTYTNSITYDDGTPNAWYYAEIYFKAANSSGSDTATLTTGWVKA